MTNPKWLTEECDDCRLTELGARVLEILRGRGPFLQAVMRSDKGAQSALGKVYGEALSLGLLEIKAKEGVDQ